MSNKNWDAATMGHGKHDFRHIDPDTINPSDYAKNLHGEQQQFGEIRQYNSAYNQKHPENDLDLDWLGRMGTVFETEAEGYLGTWIVTNMPVVKAPHIWCRAKRLAKFEELQEAEPEVEISCILLGSAVNEQNLFEQVKSRILKKGSVDRTQRIKLTKKT